VIIIEVFKILSDAQDWKNLHVEQQTDIKVHVFGIMEWVMQKDNA
jgi:hypothetical protein